MAKIPVRDNEDDGRPLLVLRFSFSQAVSLNGLPEGTASAVSTGIVAVDCSGLRPEEAGTVAGMRLGALLRQLHDKLTAEAEEYNAAHPAEGEEEDAPAEEGEKEVEYQA